MRIFPLSIAFLVASAMSAPRDATVQVAMASSNLPQNNTTSILVLEPVGDGQFCGAVPARISDHITIDTSNLAYCFNGHDQRGKLYSCELPIMPGRVWQTIEARYAQGQKLSGGVAGKIAVSPADCQLKG